MPKKMENEIGFFFHCAIPPPPSPSPSQRMGAETIQMTQIVERLKRKKMDDDKKVFSFLI